MISLLVFLLCALMCLFDSSVNGCVVLVSKLSSSSSLSENTARRKKEEGF